MDERISRVCAMYQKLNPQMNVGPETTINNARIQDICMVDGAAYRRVVEWLEKKTSTQPTDTELFKREMDVCFELLKGRNKKYGDSWKVLTIPALANLIEMKMHRVANMDTQNLDPKVRDEFMDSMNYAVMGLIKLNDK